MESFFDRDDDRLDRKARNCRKGVKFLDSKLDWIDSISHFLDSNQECQLLKFFRARVRFYFKIEFEFH